MPAVAARPRPVGNFSFGSLALALDHSRRYNSFVRLF